MVRKLDKRISGYRVRQPRNQKRTILIALEGKNKTERLYFNHFNNRNNDYIIIFAKGNTTDPVNMIYGLIKEIDIMAQINKGLGDPNSLQDFSNVLDGTNHRHISWSEDGYEIKVEFYQGEIGIQSLSTIRITSQLDTTYSDWLEFNCEFDIL